jgi:hypothetical protein
MAGLVVGCATGGSSGACPALVPYGAATQQRILAELDRLPAEAVLPRLIEDYGNLRARIRAACHP